MEREAKNAAREESERVRSDGEPAVRRRRAIQDLRKMIQNGEITVRPAGGVVGQTTGEVA